MISFNEYCLHEAAMGVKPDYKVIPFDDAAKTIIDKCSDSLWMFENNTYIFRGDQDDDRNTLLEKTNALYVDTSKTIRRSQNTANFYTIVLDELLPPKFPRRSRSFICTAPRNRMMYGTQVVVIPFNTCKIGNTNKLDIWFVKSRYNGKTLFDFNVELGESRIDNYVKNWDDIVKLDKGLKTGTVVGGMRDSITTAFGEEAITDLIGTLKKIYSPKALNLTTINLKAHFQRKIQKFGLVGSVS